MRIQPRHLAPCQGNLSRKQSTSNTQAGLQCKPGVPCPVPCPSWLKGSLNPALRASYGSNAGIGTCGAIRPKVLSKEETQAGGHSWGASLHSETPSGNSW